MTRPRLLLVPSFTELEWGIRDQLKEWAHVVTFVRFRRTPVS